MAAARLHEADAKEMRGLRMVRLVREELAIKLRRLVKTAAAG